ncbi:MAG: sorbosone dehydrogenase family protein [Pseudomonadota bacterium]
MRTKRVHTSGLIAILSLVVLCGCSSGGDAPVSAGVGTDPTLPDPDTSLIPVVNIAPARGWENGAMPVARDGLQVNAFASGLDHPRWIYMLPNGDVLVAESNAPRKLGGVSGIKGWVARRVMKKAGAATASANRITLLRDADGDGVAELQTPFLENLYSPFGMVLIDDYLYVANTDAIVRFPYQSGQTSLTAAAVEIAELPAGEINQHWTKSLVASEDGQTLYVGVGSNSNIAENGMDNEVDRAAVLKIDIASGQREVFTSGLRNPVGLAWHPITGALWTVVNERDELGNNLVPDYLTEVKQGAFYGWPYSYFGQNIDTRVKPQKPSLVAQAIAPDYALGAHVAALGLEFYQHPLMPDFQNGAFIGLHGSWNRKPHSGYKVIFVPFENGRPIGQPLDILTGFLDSDNNAQGRPVGVVTARDGAVLVADDVGNIIWRVAPN